jgi:hypothetical protein
MQRTKSSSTRKAKKLSTIDIPLQDIRKKLGLNYALYEESLKGIISAIARQEDTSAWLEQLQQLVNGVEEVRFSHQGVLFLLEEMKYQVAGTFA